MNNNELIADAVKKSNIYTDEELEAINDNGIYMLHTKTKWKKLGYTLKKGQEPKIVTKLWKRGVDDFILANAYLYDVNQVTSKKLHDL